MARLSQQFVALVTMSVLVAAPAFADKNGGKNDKKPAPAGGNVQYEPESDSQAGESKDLSSAKKLYDKGDYYEASIQFYKVIKNSSDTPANVQEAEFYMGKTLFHMRYYAAALQYFSNIVDKGASHAYYRKTLQWLAALQQVLPESAGILKKIGSYQRQDLEDPALASVKANLYYLLGRFYYESGQLDQAVDILGQVPDDSEFYVKSKFFQAVSHTLQSTGKSDQAEGTPGETQGVNGKVLKDALDELKEILRIAADPQLRHKYPGAEVRQYEELADLTMGRVFYETGQYETSIKYFEKLPQESPEWLDSLFEASWAYYMMKQNGNPKALGNIHTLNAPYFEDEFFPESLILKSQIYYNYCRYDRALEALAEFDAVYPPLRDDLRKIIAMNADDNPAFYAFVKKIRNGTANLSDRTMRMAQTALQDKTLLKTFQWVDELDRESAQYDGADKAWKTTSIAGDVLQSLTLQKSLAEDSAGSLARDRLDRLQQELTQLNGDKRAVKISILEARVGNKRKELQGEEIAKTSKEDPIIVDDEHQTWDFQGEYWKDELGFYRVHITSECPAHQ